MPNGNTFLLAKNVFRASQGSGLSMFLEHIPFHTSGHIVVGSFETFWAITRPKNF